MPSARAVVLALCAFVLLGAAPASALDWGPCPPADGQDPRQECALLTVPRDHAQPAGATIDVAVSRIRTADPARRRGVLLMNPGGPGSRGLDMPSELAQVLPADVLAAYDLVGFDPRGIGRSAPVSCALTPAQQDVMRFLPWPDPDGDIGANVAYARDVAAQCQATSGALLAHNSTANTARDMDRLRAALGEERISYVGYSYGTYLGAVYASLFPARADRFVLDSNIHPRRVWRDVFRAWGPATEVAALAFFDWVAERDDVYGLGDDALEVRREVLALAARLDADPVTVGTTVVTGNVLRETIREALYDDDTYGPLADLLAALRAMRPLSGAALAAFPEIPEDNPYASTWAVVCADARWPADPETYRRDVQADRARFPLVGAMAANIWPCAFWPAPREAPVRVGGGDGPGRVLVVQSVLDPSTPYDGGVAMRQAFAGRSGLVSVGTPGHGFSFFGENACADARAGAFLLGAAPADAWCPDVEEPPAARSGRRDEAAERIRARGRPL